MAKSNTAYSNLVINGEKIPLNSKFRMNLSSSIGIEERYLCELRTPSLTDIIEINEQPVIGAPVMLHGQAEDYTFEQKNYVPLLLKLGEIVAIPDSIQRDKFLELGRLVSDAY